MVYAFLCANATCRSLDRQTPLRSLSRTIVTSVISGFRIPFGSREGPIQSRDGELDIYVPARSVSPGRSSSRLLQATGSNDLAQVWQRVNASRKCLRIFGSFDRTLIPVSRLDAGPDDLLQGEKPGNDLSLIMIPGRGILHPVSRCGTFSWGQGSHRGRLPQ